VARFLFRADGQAEASKKGQKVELRVVDRRCGAHQGHWRLRSVVDGAVVRGSQKRKRGSLTASALRAKLADYGIKSSGLVTELRGDVGQRASLDEEGTQGLIATVKGLLGRNEQLTARYIVDDAGSDQ
jgi:hypothetical protein